MSNNYYELLKTALHVVVPIKTQQQSTGAETSKFLTPHYFLCHSYKKWTLHTNVEVGANNIVAPCTNLDLAIPNIRPRTPGGNKLLTNFTNAIFVQPDLEIIYFWSRFLEIQTEMYF